MTEVHRTWAGLLAGLGGSALLLAVAPAPATAVHAVLAAGTAPDPTAPLLGAVALLAELLLCWLLVVALVTAASRLPGWGGPFAGRLAARLAPLAVRRLVELALGLSVVVAGAVPASAGTVQPAPVSLDWPAATASPVPAGVDLDWPAATPAPPPAARPTARPAVRPVGLRRTSPSLVTVQPGDSLWAIAADHLPAGASDAQVAQAWPSWWAANRDVVGADPDLIHPGMQLTPPAQS